MKTRLDSQSFLATLAVLFALICWGGPLNAQQPSPNTQQPQTQQPAPAPPADTQAPAQAPDQAPPQTPNQATPSETNPAGAQAQSAQDKAGDQTFTGTVMKQGDRFVLQDATTGVTYDIDHQDEVKKFEGKKVRVHGTLDPSGKMIRVQ